jgi:hypothetical protein
MNALTPQKPQAPNPYESYGSTSRARRLIGTPLKFNKGEFLTGPKDDPRIVPLGTRLIAIPQSFGCCWQRFVGAKPAFGPGGLISEGFVLPPRHTLGDLEEALWTPDEITGEPRDPWCATHFACLAPSNMTPVYTFISSSYGGVEALKDLSAEYGKRLKLGGGGYPLVELAVDAYNHKNPRFGRIRKPRFLPVIEWVASARFDAAYEAARDGAGGGAAAPEPERLGPPTAGARRLDPPSYINDAPPIEENAYGGGVIDDDIPF